MSNCNYIKLPCPMQVIWWGFSSCTSNLQAAKGFLGGQTDKSVLYIIEGGSSARDVRKYAHFQGNAGDQDEDEVLMPFGSAFTVVTAAETTTNFLQVTLRQTHTFVYGGEQESDTAVHKRPPPPCPNLQHSTRHWYSSRMPSLPCPLMRSAEATTFTSRCPLASWPLRSAAARSSVARLSLIHI